MTTDERSLATWLAAHEDEELARVLTSRGVSPAATWHDFFDASAALLDAASIDRALARLPRTALTALHHSVADERLVRLALTDSTGTPYAAVAVRADAARARRPEAFDDLEPVAAPPATELDSASAAERALTATGALADLLLASRTTPLARTGAGAVSAVDRKRLADAGAFGTADDLDDLVQAAAAARLLAPAAREWTTTAEAGDWLESTTVDRWATIAEGLRGMLPSGLRTANGGFVTSTQWLSAYPLDPEWPARATQIQRIAERWGVVTATGAEPEWATSLRAGGRTDVTALAALLPPEIDRVYLQADLSAIAPGPLVPALDIRLRRIALRESRAQASTYRFTAASLTAGMTHGESAASIREFLETLSLTGLPQPLDYLIETTAARHGLVRVRSEESTGRTLIETADSGLRDAIAVDQALRPLGFTRSDGMLSSRVARDSVYWALADARYPVVAIDDEGALAAVHRRGATRSESGGDGGPERYAPLISRLRESHDSDSDVAWLGRELEQAVRAHATIVVTVRLPDGAERAFTLEATGLGGGRLRGRDRGADIERTLPVSSIASVRPATD